MGPPGLKQDVLSGHGTMSAAVMEAVGPPSVLHFKTDVPMPFRCVCAGVRGGGLAKQLQLLLHSNAAKML
jgi:hypothetical protein